MPGENAGRQKAPAPGRGHPPRERPFANDLRSPAPDIPAQSFLFRPRILFLDAPKLTRLSSAGYVPRDPQRLQLSAQRGRQISNFGVAAQLQRANVGDDSPTVARRNLIRVDVHCRETVRDVVVELTV